MISATALPLLVVALAGSYIFPLVVGAIWAKPIIGGIVGGGILSELLAWLYSLSMQLARFALAGAAAEEMAHGRRVQAGSGIFISIILTAWNIWEGMTLVSTSQENGSQLAGMVVASALLGLLLEVRLVINLADEGQTAAKQRQQQQPTRQAARPTGQSALFTS